MSAEVYRAYDAAGRLLYVGCSSDVDTRLKAHATDSSWWPFHARVERVSYLARAEAEAAEAEAIATEYPRWNVIGRSLDHPDGYANSYHRATWLEYERDVARRLRKLRDEEANLRRKFLRNQMALRATLTEVTVISSGEDASISEIDSEALA